ncbi:MAG TPA: hypothetical protein ENN66_02295 [Proteobacteria bacterium]|nr:hypothetical protein [Pseudomonadota bacterium]
MEPDHLDSHQHFVLFPALSDLVLDLHRELNILALRRPLPAESPPIAKGREKTTRKALTGDGPRWP